MEGQRKVFDGWLTIDQRGWERRRGVVGWLNAGFGLLCVATGIVLLGVLGGRADLAVLISLIVVIGLPLAFGGVGFALGRHWSVLVLWAVSHIMLLAFPVGTLLGLYTLWVLYSTRDRTNTSLRALLITSAIAVLVLGLARSAALQPDSPHSPMARATLTALDEQGARQEFERWVSRLPTDSGDAVAAGMAMGRRGMLRLGADDQLTRIRLTVDILGRASPAACAASARGSATREQQLALIEALDSTSLAQLAQVTARAIIAELHDAPAPTVATDDDIRAFVDFLYEVVPEADQERLGLALDSIATVSDADACWFARLFYSRSLEPHPSRARWLLVLTTLDARSLE
jgi:hypothetical protein